MSRVPHPLTLQHRSRQLALRAVTIRELTRLWPALDWRRLDQTYPAWALSVGRIVSAHRVTSAGLAGSYLRAFRAAHDVTGGPVILAGAVDAEQLATALRVTSVVAAKRAAMAGLSADEAMRSALVQSSGAASRLVLEGGRQTLMESLRRDLRRPRFQRVTSGAACEFCRMLAGRGAVYAQDTGGFDAHDHCGCTAEPVYLN